MSRLVLLASIALSACTGTPYQIAATPRMVMICETSPPVRPQATLDMAEAGCQRNGLHAALIRHSDERCSFGAGTVMGRVAYFDCVP